MTDQVKLFQQELPWPGDLARYYEQLDRERGFEPGYKQDKPARARVGESRKVEK
jgi:hypothetical protein